MLLALLLLFASIRLGITFVTTPPLSFVQVRVSSKASSIVTFIFESVQVLGL